MTWSFALLALNPSYIMLDQETKLAIFRAQTQNVRELDRAWTQLERAINESLRLGRRDSASLITKSLALVFCAWAEANLSKLIHTPYGFELGEIEQIKEAWKDNLEAAWRKTLELGLQHAPSRGRSNHLPNIQQKVTRIIDEYAIKPSLVRNKLAHGQWKIALNRENTGENVELTKKIQQLDWVAVERWREAHRVLAGIIETLIESPERAFNRDYWKAIVDLEQELKRREGWTLETKIVRLKSRPKPNTCSVKI